jgi:hypothetical protein
MSSKRTFFGGSLSIELIPMDENGVASLTVYSLHNMKSKCHDLILRNKTDIDILICGTSWGQLGLWKGDFDHLK